MKQPKYDIGTVFYIGFTVDKDSPAANVKSFLQVPTVAVITHISIDKKEIVYTMKEYQARNEGEIIREKRYTENEKIFQFSSHLT